MTTYEDELTVDLTPTHRLLVAYELDPESDRSRVRTRIDRREPPSGDDPEGSPDDATVSSDGRSAAVPQSDG
ncbi:hypothetical protein ACFQE1_20000, partial [Halobium palmae]